MTIEKGFVSKVEYIKHLDGDWRTVHNLWRHIRNYMTTYPAPQATTYTKTEVDAFFEGYSGGKAQVDAGNVVGLTQGSIPFADSSGFLTEDNANLFWDATNKRLKIASASTEDPALILKTTNTAHEVYFALDESAAADHVDFIGQTAGVDTYFHVIGKAGQTAKVGVQIGAYRGELICGSAGHISLLNITEDKNLILGIDDGGTDKTITWDAANDKLKHSHGLFNFDDDNILTTGTLGCGTITVANGSSINLQEDITFTGATGVNLIKFPDNLPDAFSFMEGANPYQTFITTNGSEAIQFHEDVLLKASTEYGATNKTTGAWSKSIGSGGDYTDWATMIAAMPNLIAHAVTVTIDIGTTLTEICDIKNKHGITSAGEITIQAERYYPTVTAIPTADSATATTLRDAVLAAEGFGDDYFNDCWILVVDGTGTDNGFVLITDYDDGNGDVVVAGWPGTEPDNTSRYIIVGALIDCGGTRNQGFNIQVNTCPITLLGIGIDDADLNGAYLNKCSSVDFGYCGIHGSDRSGIQIDACLRVTFGEGGLVNNNTDNSGVHGGVLIGSSNYVQVGGCGISDNNRKGVAVLYNSYGYVINNFGDNNGLWGTWAEFSGQARIVGTECSGATGNHSDPGTAGDDNADQASAYV